MGDTIIEERVETGISEHNLQGISRRRVPVENNLDVFFENFQHTDADTSIKSMQSAHTRQIGFQLLTITVYYQLLTERALQFSPARDPCRVCNRCCPPGPASWLQ